MNFLELIARHWAVTSVEAGGGRGGVPELTSTDVAHAMGCVGNKFDRDVVLTIWNFYGVPHQTRADVESQFRVKLINEYAQRERDLVAARLDLHMMECEFENMNNVSLRHKALRSYRAAVDRAKERLWPWEALTYRRTFNACAAEIRSPRICPDCNGQMAVFIEERKIECPGCTGTGRKGYMKTARASAIGTTYERYRETWHKVYEWAYAELYASQTRVLDDLVRVLSRDEEIVNGVVKTA